MVSFEREALGAPTNRGPRRACKGAWAEGRLLQPGKFMQVQVKTMQASLVGPAQAPAKWGGTASKGPRVRPASTAAVLQQRHQRVAITGRATIGRPHENG